MPLNGTQGRAAVGFVVSVASMREDRVAWRRLQSVVGASAVVTKKMRFRGKPGLIGFPDTRPLTQLSSRDGRPKGVAPARNAGYKEDSGDEGE